MLLPEEQNVNVEDQALLSKRLFLGLIKGPSIHVLQRGRILGRAKVEFKNFGENYLGLRRRRQKAKEAIVRF